MLETCIINGVESTRGQTDFTNSVEFDDISPSTEVEVKVQRVKMEQPVKVKQEKIPKERINGLIPKTLYDQLKNIVLWNSDTLTMTDLLIQGLTLVVEKYPELPIHGGKLKIGRRAKKVDDSGIEIKTINTPKSRVELEAELNKS